MKYIKDWFSTFIILFFPSISAYRSHDKKTIEYIENNTLIEMNCKRILHLSWLLVLIPLLGCRSLYPEKKYAFLVVLFFALFTSIYTIYVSNIIYKATKLPGNGIISRKKYFEKLYSHFWHGWTFGMIMIGFSKLNAEMNGAYLYLTQLALAFLPLITPKKFKKIALYTAFWAVILILNIFYYEQNDIMLPIIIFILNNMILVYIIAFIIQNLNVSVNVMVAYVRMVGFLDQLTNVYNRRGYQLRINELISENVEAGIIMLDIDFFKKYNDKFGHLKGDEILRTISSSLKNMLDPDKYIIVRFGGEEFAIVCLNSTLNETQKIAQNIMDVIQSLEIPSADTSVSEFLTVSIGLCHQTISKDMLIDDLVNSADKALYQAKETGRNKIVVF